MSNKIQNKKLKFNNGENRFIKFSRSFRENFNK